MPRWWGEVVVSRGTEVTGGTRARGRGTGVIVLRTLRVMIMLDAIRTFACKMKQLKVNSISCNCS